MSPALIALASAACFGAALIVVHFGLRYGGSYAGARVSLSTSFVLWWLVAPFQFDISAWHFGAAAVFALVGLFYPAAVTVLTNESNRQLGPTLTGTIGSTAPLFATALAVLLLGETLTLPIVVGGAMIVGALVLMSWRGSPRASGGWRLMLPIGGAILRGLAQTLSKVGLNLWPSPYAATLISYTVSGATIWGVTLARPAQEDAYRLKPGGAPWFIAAGIVNALAVFLLYEALHRGRVSVVAPLVALYPLFTLLYSALFLRTEALTRRVVVGALCAVAGVVVLVRG